MPLPRVKVSSSPTLEPLVDVNGVQVRARHVVVELGPAQLPMVQVTLYADQAVWEGEGIVRIVTDETGQVLTERDVVAGFLEGVDVERLRAAALNGGMGTDPVEAVLVELARLAQTH